MLEPISSDPKILLDHHRRRAKLCVEAGDQKGAQWHGIQAQRAFKAVEGASK